MESFGASRGSERKPNPDAPTIKTAVSIPPFFNPRSVLAGARDERLRPSQWNSVDFLPRPIARARL